MADAKKSSDGPAVDDPEAWDFHTLPDWDNDFVSEDDVLAFASALSAPENVSPSEEDLLNPQTQKPEFFTALNDWKPINQRVKGNKSGSSESKNDGKRKKRRKRPQRGRDETREGWTYSLLRWPLLFLALSWLVVLGASYFLVRGYIWWYEHYVTWRGRRESLRKRLSQQTSYQDWIKAAKELDRHLGSDRWKEDDESSYYQYHTIRRALLGMRRLRQRAEAEEQSPYQNEAGELRPIDELRQLAESCIKNNFSGFEDVHLYSETYYGTKDLIQDFVDEASRSLRFVFSSNQLSQDEKRKVAKHLDTNFGRTALCLSGGATFAYYHFGLAKALLDARIIPDIITGTSGGALVAALLGTRTNEELKKLLIPALAHRITACHDSVSVWLFRWWRTGARFDSVDWAKRCGWFCRGSLTFLEAYQRTGRILNVSCVPSDPHSPTILANYLTAPDCVVWSAVLASAAVPGILNPVVLMRKLPSGKLEPYSFGHKWKDGSLRTDIPLQSLNLHFNVNFSIVSQVNPHVNLFFFSSRGNVGRPVTHRRGRGWRGGYLGSAIENYLKQDLQKWLRFLRHMELLPRPLGQDWSQIWLQRFGGTITIWPKSIMSDFWNILSDPTMERLARMIHVGQQAAWPKLKFIGNRIAIEKEIQEARKSTRPPDQALPTPMPEKGLRSEMFSEDDLKSLLKKAQNQGGPVELPSLVATPPPEDATDERLSFGQRPTLPQRQDSPSLSKRLGGWFNSRAPSTSSRTSIETVRPGSEQLRSTTHSPEPLTRRSGSFIREFKNQSAIFFDDDPNETTADEEGESNHETDDDVAPYGDDSLRRRAGRASDRDKERYDGISSGEEEETRRFRLGSEDGRKAFEPEAIRSYDQPIDDKNDRQ